MDSKSDGDGKCRGGDSELEQGNRVQFDQKRLDSNNDGWLLNELLHDWSHMDEYCSNSQMNDIQNGSMNDIPTSWMNGILTHGSMNDIPNSWMNSIFIIRECYSNSWMNSIPTHG